MSTKGSEDVIHSEFVHVLPDHETELRNKLYQQWQENLYCDVTLYLKGGELHAHSCVLAAFSPKLKIIMENSVIEKSIHLSFEERVFQCLLNMMYTGVLSFNTAMMTSVLSTAQWLQMDEVVRFCQDYKDVMGDSCSDYEIYDDSVLTEVHIGSVKDGEVPFNQAEDLDKVPETKSHAGKQKRGRKRGSSSKTVSSPRGPRGKSRKANILSPVTIKLEPGTETNETRSEIQLSDPVDAIPDKTTKKTPQKARKKKSTPTKTKQRRAKSQNKRPASPLITQVKTENPSPDESMDSSFTDHSVMSHVQWVEAQGLGSSGKEDTDFAMGKTDHIRCKKCLVKFTDLSKYLCHMADHPSFKCDHCNVTYYRLSNLTRHMRTSHSTEHHLQCKKCEFAAGTESALRNHFKEAHGGDKPFICDHPGCTYSSWKLEFLNRHSEIHSEVKRHLCNNCGQGFSQHAGLMSHQRTCYQLQQFLCDVCGQAFNHVQSMRAHRRTIHFGEKPYLCKVCGNQFSDQRNLKRHMRIHENSFPYQCPVCQQNYRHSNSLKAHLKKHEKELPEVNVSCMKVKDSVKQKKGPGRRKLGTDVTGEASGSGHSGDFAVGPEFEQGFLLGSGQSGSNTVMGTFFPPPASHPAAGSSAATGGLHVTDQNLNLEATDLTPIVYPTRVSRPATESFPATSSLSSGYDHLEPLTTTAGAGGPTVIKVELSSVSSSETLQSLRHSEASPAVDEFGRSRKIAEKDCDGVGESDRDAKLKGQPSYGLQTLAEICFSSSV
ncbi:uncharacterized protein LOC143286044 [Babylonia areolata]|uniref:uncharacterized protein LOC143286044 n=1 Tax=Babylonia areolata TaxID=304850 RepID=UPI003FD092C1